MLFLISRGNIFQRGSPYREIVFERRFMDYFFPFVAIPYNIIPYHSRCILKHIRKQAAPQKRLAARFYHQIISDRDGQLSL